jgi:hypothetical protein
MGVSTNGILAYGYALGGPEDGWAIAEAGEYGEWTPEWADDDLVGDAERHLLVSVGFTEDDWRADGYHDRRKAAQARVGVELEMYCSIDYPMYALVAHATTVYQGDAKKIDLAALERQRDEEGWDSRLRAALDALGMTPEQQAPGWLLLSFTG